MPHWLQRALLGSVLLTVLGVGGIGLLHVPVVRNALAHAGIRWGCPLPVATPVQVETAFGTATRQQRGTEPAPVRPAAGLELGVTSLASSTAWAAQHRLSCKTAEQGYTLVRCENVPAHVIAEHGAPVELLTLVFDASNTLRSVDVWRGQLSNDVAAKVFGDLSAELEHTLGAPSVRSGQATADQLAVQFAQASQEYRFSDYLAKLTATHIPGKGVAVRTQYTRL